MKKPRGSLRRCVASVFVCAGLTTIIAGAGFAYADNAGQTPEQLSSTNAAPVQTTAIATPIDAERVVQFLDQIIAWYHHFGAQQRLASDTSDDVYVSADRQLANEVVRLAFQFARTQAEAAQSASASSQT